MAKVDKITCDWDACKEWIEIVRGQSVAEPWLELAVTNFVTNQTTMFHLGPTHAKALRLKGLVGPLTDVGVKVV